MAEKEESAEAAVRTLHRVTRKRYSADNMVRIVLEGLRGETSIAGLCRREGVPSNLSSRWSKDFLEAGKQRRVGDTTSTSGPHRISKPGSAAVYALAVPAGMPREGCSHPRSWGDSRIQPVIQRRLLFSGLQAVILPIRVHLKRVSIPR